MIKEVTQKECVEFSVSMFRVLEQHGFHVHTAREAFACLTTIIKVQVANEVQQSMEELQCQNCKATSGSKNTVRLN